MTSPATRAANCRRDFEQCNRVESTQAAVTIANTMAITAAIGSLVSQTSPLWTHLAADTQAVRIQGSDNDVRIFQLVQDCQLNRSPGTPSGMRVTDVTEDSQAVEPPAAPAASDKHQSSADKAVTGHGAEQIPATCLNSNSQSLKHNSPAHEQCHSRATIKNTQSSGHSPVDTPHTAPRMVVLGRPATAIHHSEFCTVVDSQSGSGTGAEGMVLSRDGGEGGGHSEPQHCSLNVVSESTLAAAPVQEQEKQAAADSEQQAAPVPAVDTAQAGCEGSDRIASPPRRAVVVQQPEQTATEGESAPAEQKEALCEPAEGEVAAAEVAAAEVAAAEVAEKGAAQCAPVSETDQPAGMHHRDHPQPEVCDKTMCHVLHTSDEEEEQVDEDDGNQEDELGGFLPTQIDGLDDLLLLPVDAVEPVDPVEERPAEVDDERNGEALQDAAPSLGEEAERAAPQNDAPGTKCNTEQPVLNSCATLSCVVPDSVNRSPRGTQCFLSLLPADKDSTDDAASPAAACKQIRTSQPAAEAPKANPPYEAFVVQQHEEPLQTTAKEKASAPEQENALCKPGEGAAHIPPSRQDVPCLHECDAPAVQLEHVGKQPCAEAHSEPVELDKASDDNAAECLPVREDSAFEVLVEVQVHAEHDYQNKAAAFKQAPSSDVAAPERLQAGAAAGQVPVQPSVSNPGQETSTPSKLPLGAVAATPAGSGRDGTVCDSEDVCMDDGGAVDSAPAPSHKQVEAREKECMSDTIQDTRTQAKQPDVPDSQQTVRQQRAPPTPVLMQRNPRSQPETPDMFGGPAVSGKAAVSAKPAKSRGGAQVAAVVGQPEKSTATAGDMHCVSAVKAKAVAVKLPQLPAQPAPPSSATPPQPRSRHDRARNQRAAHVQHDARIHKAAGAAAGYAPQGTAASCQGANAVVTPPVSPRAAPPHSRGPSLAAHPDSRTPPRGNSGSVARGSKAATPQRTPSPLPHAAPKVPRSDLGAAPATLMRSPGPTTSHRTTTPEQSKGAGSKSHSRSPSMHDNRSAGSTPSKSTYIQEPRAHGSDYRQGDRAPLGNTDQATDIAAKGGQAAATPATAAEKHQTAREQSDVHRSMHANTSKPSGSHATCREALNNAAKNTAMNAAMTSEQTSSGPVHVSCTCLVTDSQLSLQNWINDPTEQTQKTAPKKSPPRFPKSPPQKLAPTAAPTAADEDSDDDFDQLVSHSAGVTANLRVPFTETEKEEIEWGHFQQRRSHGKPSHVLDSQSAIDFVSEVDLGGDAPYASQARNEEDIPLVDRGKRKLPQTGGRRVKHQLAPAGACSGESAGVQAAGTPLRIPRIAVASQQGSQEIERGGAKAQKLPRAGAVQGLHSAPSATKSPAAGAGGAVRPHKAAGTTGWKNRSPCNVPERAAHAQHAHALNHKNGTSRKGALTAAKSPLRDTGNIPVGLHLNAQKWVQDGDRDYRCKQEPETPADRSPRRSARIAQHKITPAADADKALANLSQMCILTQDTSEVDDPDYDDGGQIPTLPLHRTTDQGNRQNADKKPLQSPPGHRKRKLATELAFSKPQGVDENGQHCRAPQMQCARTPGGGPAHARSADAPPGQKCASTPQRTHTTPRTHQRKQSPVSRDPHHSTADVSRRPTANTRDVQPTPPRSPTAKPFPKASAQAGGSSRRAEMEWIEPAVQKTSWKVFYNGLCSSSIGEVHCGDVVAVETPRNQIMIKVNRMWENVCVQENYISGVRVYPLLDTPVHAFAPSGVDKKRCVALGEDSYTFERDSILRKLSVVFVGEGKGFTTEVEALHLMRENPAALLCRLVVQDSGGAMPLN